MTTINEHIVSTISTEDLGNMLDNFTEAAYIGGGAHRIRALESLGNLNEWYGKVIEGYETDLKHPDHRDEGYAGVEIEHAGVGVLCELYSYLVMAFVPTVQNEVKLPASLHFKLIALLSSMSTGEKRFIHRVLEKMKSVAIAGTGHTEPGIEAL